MKVCVVMPTYNERPNLERVAGLILQHPWAHLLVVDDASPDGTGEIADRLSKETGGRMSVLHRQGPRGLGLAYVDGLRHALSTGAEAIGQIDADLSHDPKYLPDLLRGLDNYDLVLGSRYLKGISVVNWPLHRIMLSLFANRYIRTITGLSTRDCTGAFRMWRRDALVQMPLDHAKASGYAFLTEMLYEAARRGFRIGEVPIVFVEREKGYSKVSRRVLTESLMTPWRLVIKGGRVRAKDRGQRAEVRSEGQTAKGGEHEKS
jgi:dolichol-phosphate mannosyltransferase